MDARNPQSSCLSSKFCLWESFLSGWRAGTWVYVTPIRNHCCHNTLRKRNIISNKSEQWNNVAFGNVNTINAWQKIFSRRKRLKVCPGRIPSKIPSHESVSCLAAQFRCCYWNNERKSTGQGPRLRDAVKRRTVQYWDLCGDCATKWSSGWLLL